MVRRPVSTRASHGLLSSPLYGEENKRKRVSELKGQNVKNVTGGRSEPGKRLDDEMESISFVMTVWLESREVESEPEWRWRVRRSQADRIVYFNRVADVVSFIANESGLPGPQ